MVGYYLLVLLLVLIVGGYSRAAADNLPTCQPVSYVTLYYC